MLMRLALAALFSFGLALPAVQAADIVLGSGCQLADAILAANHDRAEGGCPAGRGADAIRLTRDIALDGGLPKIVSDITIEGAGYAISGGRHRIFYNEGGALTIHNLTMIEGRAEGEPIRNADGSLRNTTANPIGGALVNWGGAVTISDSAFSDNSAEGNGGVILNGEGGELSISDSTFSDNSTEGGGGAIANYGELSISDSAFSGNSAVWGGGAILNGEGGELSISGSAFSDNLANGLGGAIFNGEGGAVTISDSAFSGNSGISGGAIFNGEGGELSISDSAFSDNSAFQGGAIDNNGEGTIDISSSTFSGNSAEYGGALFNSEGGELSIVNSIIAGSGGDACVSESRLKQNIRNFIQDGSCDAAFSGDPMLGDLVEPADGSPAYIPLLAGSRAIDAGDDAYCSATDQLGRPRPQGAGCDLGAVEYGAES